MNRRVALALVVLMCGIAVFVAPAAGTTAFTSGMSTTTVSVHGVERNALVYVPASVAARPSRRVPLVLHLHGALGSPENSAATTHLVEAADAHSFVLAFPRGTQVALTLPNGAGYVWNAGSCCGVASRDNVDDVTFLDSLITQLETQYPIDRSRVVTAGHSNGAMMTWRFACEQPGVLAAAMPVAGSLETADPSACRPRRTSLLAVHGDADLSHPIGGGQSTRSLANIDFHPFADSVATYAAAAHCSPRPTTTPGEIATTTGYRRCTNGITTVTAVVLHGADHPWPGGVPTGTAIQGEPFTRWSATDALVDLVSTTKSRSRASRPK